MACSRLEKKEITIELAEQEAPQISSLRTKNGKSLRSSSSIRWRSTSDIRPEDIKGKKRNSEIVFPTTDCHVSLPGRSSDIPLKSDRNHTWRKKDHTTSYPRRATPSSQTWKNPRSTRNTVEIIKKKTIAPYTGQRHPHGYQISKCSHITVIPHAGNP